MFEYAYTKSPVALDKLTQEIQNSSITTALDHISALGTTVSIVFKLELSEQDSATLDSIVAAHDGQPLPQNSIQQVAVQVSAPFAAKTINVNGVLKKLYKRLHGIQQQVNQGNTTFAFAIPYPWVKILGVEVIGGDTLDSIDFFVLDSTTGTYTGVPNYVLNQFGYDVNVRKEFYREESSYDADLYQGMQIKIVYKTQTSKTIAINFDLNEVK